jgi:hypothetical protein
MLSKMTKAELLELAKRYDIPGIHARMKKSDILSQITPHVNAIKYCEKREKIQTDLLDQLERNGTFGEFYVDLVNDYMAMWDVKNKLIADIEEKGVSVRYQNGENQWGYKKNDSVGELQRINNQMLNILKHLELKPSKADTETFDFEDLEM